MENEDHERRIGNLEQNFSEFEERNRERRKYVDDEFQKLRVGLSANTQLTAESKHELHQLREEVQPVVDAMKTMQAGIRTIGHIGTVGTKVGKALLILAASWGALKIFSSGATWDEVVSAFWRVMSGGR